VIISGRRSLLGEIVAGFDGFVSRYMGDGVLVYFGYPQAVSCIATCYRFDQARPHRLRVTIGSENAQCAV
jgi:class 3 adenylate cyclase